MAPNSYIRHSVCVCVCLCTCIVLDAKILTEKGYLKCTRVRARVHLSFIILFPFFFCTFKKCTCANAGTKRTFNAFLLVVCATLHKKHIHTQRARIKVAKLICARARCCDHHVYWTGKHAQMRIRVERITEFNSENICNQSEFDRKKNVCVSYK